MAAAADASGGNGQALTGGGSPSATCPTSTASIRQSITPAGLAGYLTAYGIMARMKVLPDATTWDGV
jgi:hypothetical protein